MLLTEYGGLNETLFDLYSDLGNEKYLRLAELFYDNKVLDPLSEGIDDLDKKHGNTQMNHALMPGENFTFFNELKLYFLRITSRVLHKRTYVFLMCKFYCSRC